MKCVVFGLILAVLFPAGSSPAAETEEGDGRVQLERRFRVPRKFPWIPRRDNPFRKYEEGELEERARKGLIPFGIHLGIGETVYYDSYDGALVVTADYDKLKMIEGVLDRLLAEEASVAKVRLSIFRLDAGADVKAVAEDAGADEMRRSYEDAKKRVEEGNGELLYAPLLVTRNSKKGQITVGQTIRFIAKYEKKGNAHYAVFEEVVEGLRMSVEGDVDGLRKRADLAIDVQFSRGRPVYKRWKVLVGGFTRVMESVELPQFQLATEVRLSDGETAYLGTLPTESGENYLVFATAGISLMGGGSFLEGEERRGGD